MWGTLAEILFGAAIAVAADAVVKKKTGRHIHQHAYRWWTGLRDAVSTWISQHPHTRVRRFVASLLSLLDGGITAIVQIMAHTETGTVKVTTSSVSLKELRTKLPGLRRKGDESVYVH